MPKQLAVAIVHGIGKQEPDFWTGMAKDLTSRFADHAKITKKAAAEALVFQPVYWAPVLAAKESLLWKKLLSGGELGLRGRGPDGRRASSARSCHGCGFLALTRSRSVHFKR